ncbi:dihydroxyacetone kinase subunit DhaL [Canibacter zhoujuaniae]|uniref:dihydroxyacetone kinase subunit DhaL n=1 Tax=Canibacter zhoujuaniae TaxID=2708343 RepID=UPI00142054B6|nr:dihydroxyacetone kinase subunit DhaL [Canibacter zhoujuaniae]
MTETVSIAQLTNWLNTFRDTVGENKEYLTNLDAEIGDADHGSNMARGTAAAADKLAADNPDTVAALGKAFGMTLVSTVGGASGPLFGTFFLRFGVSAGEVTELDAGALAAALRAGAEGVVARGKAELQDKTMVDVLLPALDELDKQLADGAALRDALAAAADKAETARDATGPLVAKKGRASYLGDRSIGHIDPGSASTAYLFRALADSVA